MGKRFQAIIFDKDGVLIDSFDSCFTAFNKTLGEFGKPKMTEEEFLNECWGIKIDNNIDRIFRKKSGSEKKRISEYYRKERMMVEKLTKLYPNVVDVLEELENDYKLGVVTSSYKDLAEEVLEDFGIKKYFEVIVGGDETEPKPSPKPIIKACKKMEVETNKTLYIGDTDPDIGAAKAAGCILAMLTTSKNKEDLEKIGDMMIIDDIMEVLNIVTL